ncbi:hypothetical protein D3C72_2464000 [compost metagenome]
MKIAAAHPARRIRAVARLDRPKHRIRARRLGDHQQQQQPLGGGDFVIVDEGEEIAVAV